MDVEKTNTLTLHLLEKATAYHRWIFEEIQPFLKGNLLEVGCGTGNLTGWLLEQGRVVATDLNQDYLELVQRRYTTHPNLITTLTWDVRRPFSAPLPHTVDTLVCSNVLEHVEEDESVLNHFFDLLSGGGRLILLVPALKILYNSLDRELGHYRRYSRKELSEKLERNRFKVIHLDYFNLFGILGWFVNGTILKRRLLPERQMKFFNTLVPLFKAAEERIPGRVGQSLIAVGEK